MNEETPQEHELFTVNPEQPPEETDGFSMKQGKITPKAIVLAGALATAAAPFAVLGVGGIVDLNALQRSGNVELARGPAHALKSVKETVTRFEAQQSHNEQLSPSMEQALHKFFPDLNLDEIRLVRKVPADGGYAYDLTSNESGEFVNPLWVTGADGRSYQLTKAFEFDDGSINFDNGQGEVLKFNGISNTLHSVPAIRAQ